MEDLSISDLCLKEAKIKKCLKIINSELSSYNRKKTESYYMILIKYRLIEKELYNIIKQINKFIAKNHDLLDSSEKMQLDSYLRKQLRKQEIAFNTYLEESCIDTE